MQISTFRHSIQLTAVSDRMDGFMSPNWKSVFGEILYQKVLVDLWHRCLDLVASGIYHH